MSISSQATSALFSKELKLLLAFMNMPPGEKQINMCNENFKDIDWDELLVLTRHHRVYPNVYDHLRQINDERIPAYVIRQLQKDYQRNTFSMLHLSSEMGNIAKQCNETGIRVLVLKGPVLADDLYGDVSLRTCSDLDILIPIDNLMQAESMLVGLGYVKEEVYKTILGDWKWRHHHITYKHPQKGIKLEIHWRLGPGPGKEIPFNELWENKRMCSITKHPVYYLGREDLFLFLASHGARHGWSRLRWLVDIDRILRQDLEHDRLKYQLKKYRQSHIAAQAIILAVKLLQTPLTNELESIAMAKRGGHLAEDAYFYIHQKVNLHTIPVPDHISKYHKRHLFSLMTYWQKVLFILSFLYPYPEDAETLKLPQPLHVLYFPLRPLLWTWRKTKKHVLS
ncbi:Renal dipeptidase [Paenibacillus sp. Soil766]|uniref:nucleotidyltransferase domain-containing protein n=1 Tax=Paenibacillus sp. Soil766 TaxID=1736404 RepID=UPI00070FD8E3|nr:nucleotidyltransferase family protein [Paenibacillus sp. Soil766]KRE97070.1 Renal dipeptidase [Paenibacillus sp. Soil766]